MQSENTKEFVMLKNFREMIEVKTVELTDRTAKRQKIDQKSREKKETDVELKSEKLRRERNQDFIRIFLMRTEDDERVSRELDKTSELAAIESSFEISQNLIKKLLKILEENEHAQKMYESLRELATHLIKLKLSR